MATVTAKRKESSGSDWDSITITKAKNGLIVRRCHDWQPGAKQQKPDETYVCDSPEEAHEYLDPCLDDQKYYGGKMEAKEEAAEKK